MKVLIAGNLGYIGPLVVAHFREQLRDATLVGFDTGYFAHCLANPVQLPEAALDVQYFGDVRDGLPKEVLRDVDAVVNLAAISNDPMGNHFESVTAEVNHQAAVAMAIDAKAAGVSRYVFASSCSVYGWAEDGARTEKSDVAPETVYARSKVDTETSLFELADENFLVTCLRFATACGMSPRLRLDLVLNDFVASALTSKRIEVLSDGTPWRPLIHVRDMARAIAWAAQRDASAGGEYLVVNGGSDSWNYQVRDLAETVAGSLAGTDVSINTDAPPDRRSYRVDFSHFRKLAPDAQPQVSLDAAILDLMQGLQAMDFCEADFRQTKWMRLNLLAGHVEEGRLTEDLRWQRSL